MDDSVKNAFYNLKFVFDQDHEYMDLELIKERLKTLKTEVTTDDSPSIYDSRTAGEYAGIYFPNDNKIVYYRANSYEDVSLGTFYHEIGHVLQSCHDYSKFMELSNEKWTREVIGKLKENNNKLYDIGDRGYEWLMSMYDDFSLLFNSKTLKKYQYINKNEILVNSITENSPEDKEQAYQMIDMIEETCKKGFIMSPEIYIKSNPELEEIVNYFSNKINQCNYNESFKISRISQRKNDNIIRKYYMLNKLGILDEALENGYIDEIHLYGSAEYNKLFNEGEGRLHIDFLVNYNASEECQEWYSKQNHEYNENFDNIDELEKEYREFAINYSYLYDDSTELSR